LPPHIAPSKATLARKPIAFIENKNPQTHPEASLLVPTELGKGVESLLEQDSKPNHLVVPFTSICVNPSYWQQDGAKASGFKVSLRQFEEMRVWAGKERKKERMTWKFQVVFFL
jgi:hypothetical protein